MDNSQLIAARKRLQGFLLPNLIGIDSFDEEDVISIFIEKSDKNTELSRNSLRLTEEISPDIDQIICNVCSRLQIPRALVNVFVFPSSELNGFCIVNELPIIVGISSTTVNMLDKDELAFVLGHEIGHALFKETSNFIANSNCLEDQILARSIEICVDRIGLLTANNKDAAFRAILKSLSGLDEKYLRFDFSHFISESREALNANIPSHLLYSSHPPLPQRFRALLAFSMSDVFLNASGSDGVGAVPIEQVNNVIQSNLNNSIDDKANLIIKEAQLDLLTWLASFLIISKKTINLSQFKSHFQLEVSKNELERAAVFIDGYNTEERSIVVNEKIRESLVKATKLAPRATSKLLKKVKEIYPEFHLQILKYE